MSLQDILPLHTEAYHLENKKTGLVVIDVIKGFCEVGAGNLAPIEQNTHLDEMLMRVNQLAKQFSNKGHPIFAFIDAHDEDRPEPPYPPHCIKHTNESELMDVLSWFHDDANVTCFEKDCINGYIGAIDPKTGHNQFDAWVKENHLETLIFVGVCTDICVSDCVLTVLSARNHDLMPGLKDVVVYLPGCSTYDMQPHHLEQFDLPQSMNHPQALMHHIGAKMMHARGAILADEIIVGAEVEKDEFEEGMPLFQS